MTVWVVETGTQFEGGHVLDLFSSRELAERYCREYAENDSAPMVESYLRDDEGEASVDRWRVKEQTIEPGWRSVLVLEWGCHYACVKPMKVRDDYSSNHTEKKP